jgi:hypothetical protein
MTKEQASALVVDVDKIAYPPEEFVSVVKRFCEVFNGIDNLVSFWEAQKYIDTGFDIENRVNTIFNLKPCTMFENRMTFLQDFFEIGKEECVSLVIQNPAWFYRKEQYFVDKTKELMEFFGLEKTEITALCKAHPFVLGKRLKGLSSTIESIAKHYNIEECKVKYLMLMCPTLMNRGESFYRNCEIGKEIFDKPWLFNCLTHRDIGYFGGYRTFTNLVLVTNKIELDIGKVIKVCKVENKSDTFIALLVEKDDTKYLVSLGSNTVTERQRINFVKGPVEERVFAEIFGVKLQFTNVQEYNHHQEYICQLNTENETVINDILRLLMRISARSERVEFDLDIRGGISYLANSNDIDQCCIEMVSKFEHDEYKLDVSFYKVEPKGNGKINIQNLSRKKGV